MKLQYDISLVGVLLLLFYEMLSFSELNQRNLRKVGFKMMEETLKELLNKIMHNYMHCQKKFSQYPLADIFITMSQIQEILYKPESEHTIQLALNMYILIFNHTIFNVNL